MPCETRGISVVGTTMLLFAWLRKIVMTGSPPTSASMSAPVPSGFA
jgi:hypothetical protein